MTTLREKMKQEMILIGLSEATQRRYIEAVTRLHAFYNKSPAKLSKAELRNYLLHLKGKKVAPNTYNIIIYALRFFYCFTLKSPLIKLELPTTRVTYKLPSILSSNEVQRIIKSTGNIKHKTLLLTIYGAGLRVSEAVNLRMGDIDSERMTLHIRCCKNRKDRLVILSPIFLEYLRSYWRHCKFKDYVFPGNDLGKHITTSTAAQIYKRAKEHAKINKPGGIHALRHAFATHMLESGVDLFFIKELLGHSSIHSTVRYLMFSPGRNKNIKLPIDQLST